VKKVGLKIRGEDKFPHDLKNKMDWGGGGGEKKKKKGVLTLCRIFIL
jgi:hypothetical protein